ncbi:MAG TPA: nucleoside hydrolase [Candidatus Saccharimonadales bacterium]
MAGLEQSTSAIAAERTPVLVYTDLGRDVDDAEALAYLTGSDNTEVVGIVTTHTIPDRRATIARAFMAHLEQPEVPIGVGSIFPIGMEDELLTKYLRDHTLIGTTYEGGGLIECFPSAEDIVMGAISKYGPALKIAALAPLTDLAKVAQTHREEFSTIGGLFIQGQAEVGRNGLIIPDPEAYNIEVDLEAADILFGLQRLIPFTLVGKHAAYPVSLSRNDFNDFESSGNQAGRYLNQHAISGLRNFAVRAPGTFTRLFNIEPGNVDQLNIISRPYDALVAMAIAHPEHFTPTRVGHHALIGMSAEDPGLVSAKAIEEELIAKIKIALNSGATG